MNATRRGLLAATAAAAMPLRLAAQESGPIKLGALVPLTGAGGAWGPLINASQKLVVDEVNAAGGVLGRQLQLVTEDTQTNPDSAVRAAHKLIDVDQVPAIMGTWASAVCSAVAPLCWEAKTVFFIIGAAESITQLPHQGYIFRTQPSTHLQADQFGRFAIEEGIKHFYIMMPQTPFTESTIKGITDLCTPKNIKVESVIYDAKKTSYRSEVDAMLRAAPDLLMLGGYQPDTVVLAKDVYRADFKGKSLGYAYAVNDQFIAAVGNQVAEGIMAMEPVPDAGSKAYELLQSKLKRDRPETYACQGYDEANLVILAIAAGKSASGTSIRDNVRRVGDPDGLKVFSAVDGIKALADGKTINYLGASGPCKFDRIGDSTGHHFRFSVVRNGKLVDYRTL